MIFSTYQSASVVGAAMQPGEAFGLGMFDEAHKTAGRGLNNIASRSLKVVQLPDKTSVN
jgi:predicted helicase